MFYPFEFCFFTQNNNRSEIIKKRNELLNLKGEEINSSEQFKCHFFPFLVITSVSLINSNKFRICLDNNLDKAIVINSSDLGQYLVKLKLKYTRKKYIKNMEESLHKFSNKIVLCKNCISKMNNKIIYKGLVQDDLSLMCQVCNKQVGLKYLQK